MLWPRDQQQQVEFVPDYGAPSALDFGSDGDCCSAAFGGRVLELEDLQKLNSVHLASARLRLRQALVRRTKTVRPQSSGARRADVSEEYSHHFLPLHHQVAQFAHALPAPPATLRPQSARGACHGTWRGTGNALSCLAANSRRTDYHQKKLFVSRDTGDEQLAVTMVSTAEAEDEDDQRSSSSSQEGSDRSVARGSRTRRRAERWIAEAAASACRRAAAAGQAQQQEAESLPEPPKESQTRRTEDTQFRGTALRSLAQRSIPCKDWHQKKQRELLEMRAGPPVKLARMREMQEGSIFQGSARNLCIVSFPGLYLKEWKGLFELVGTNRIASACVFLPENDPSRRYGRHTKNSSNAGKCYCHTLYGKQKEWGCLWFKHWAANVRRATQLGLTPLVVFLPEQVETESVGWEELAKQGERLWNNVGLGGSQKGEVAWLRRKGIKFQTTDVLNVHKALAQQDIRCLLES